MTQIQDKSFRLTDSGEVFFQPDPTNPLPGVLAAHVRRGADVLAPDLEISSAFVPPSEDFEAAARGWLLRHIAGHLDPLVRLGAWDEGHADSDPQTAGGAALREIAERLRAGLGVVPRVDIATQIADLTPEGRSVLRARGVRLAPVLVFLPALCRPAAVRLRALLWCLWQGMPLPAPVPRDGAVSVPVASLQNESGTLPPEDFLRAIGYPVYGTRAIRIDMLDRLIKAIYDSADRGVFKARHAMAEWLGVPIPDLYAVLESLGHRRILPAAAPTPAPEPAAEIPAELKAGTDTAPAMPELDSFRLGRPPSTRPKPTPDIKAAPPPPPVRNKSESPPKRHEKPQGKPPRKRDDSRESARVLRADSVSRPEDSPFAVLMRLKKDPSTEGDSSQT